MAGQSPLLITLSFPPSAEHPRRRAGWGTSTLVGAFIWVEPDLLSSSFPRSPWETVKTNPHQNLGQLKALACLEIFKIFKKNMQKCSKELDIKVSVKKPNHHNSTELQPGKKQEVFR